MADSLRRRTLLQNAFDSPCPVRANDAQERAERRSFLENQRRSSSSFNLSSPLGVNEEQAKKTLQSYKQLMDKNKIDINMAWKMRVTEMISVLNKSKIDDFNVAASSIEVAAKVYEIKVDDFCSDVIKCLANVNKVAPDDKSQDDGDDQPGAPQKKQTKRATKKNFRKSCIMEDSSKLLGELPMLEPVTVLEKTDVGSSLTDNFLTCRLPMDGVCSMFTIFEDNLKAFPIGDTDKLLEEIGDGETEFDVSALPSSGMICSAFKDFRLDHTYETNITLCEKNDSLTYELDDVPNNDACSEDEDDQQENRDPLVEQQIRELGVENSSDVMSGKANFALGTSEFSFNPLVELSDGTLVQRLWTGPHFWKFKHVIPCKSFHTGPKDKSNDAKKKSVKKAKQPIDFCSCSYKGLKVVPRKFKPPKKPPAEQIKKLKTPAIPYKFEDFFKSIGSYINKPFIVQKSTDLQIPETNDLEAEFEDLHNDCDNAFDEEHQEEERIEQQVESNRLNLVDAPEYVPTVQIAYDQTAKKMNMQKLCSYSWQLVRRLGDAIEVAEGSKITFSPVMFSKYFKELPNLLPNDMRTALSFHLAFAAMLQLCNEKSLCMKNVGYNDIVILCEDVEDDI